MKLIVQLPCLNESASLVAALADIPQQIDGVSCIETLLIDDGSTDDSQGIARAAGVTHVLAFTSRKGLAEVFREGIQEALRLGADVIVNFDADGQYRGADMAALVAPIIAGQADIVIGNRQVQQMQSYTPIKRILHGIGRRVVNRLGGFTISDPVSGYRAFSRDAARELIIYSSFSYTTETLIQAAHRRLRIAEVPVQTNRTERPSRLFKSVQHFVLRTGLTILRTYATYQPLKVFSLIGGLLMLIGAIPILRWFIFYLSGAGSGQLQSLILGSTFVIIGCVAFLFAILADLQARNRMLLEQLRKQLQRLEDKSRND
jgi:glycosyltransferase involved in cell wall biosynthesis